MKSACVLCDVVAGSLLVLGQCHVGQLVANERGPLEAL